MTVPILPEVWAFIVKQFGRVVEGGKELQLYISIATCSTAEMLLTLIKATVVEDVRRVKNIKLEELEAKKNIKVAEAMERYADARIKANEADLPKRKDAAAKLKLEQEEITNAKTQAEIDVMKMDAKTRRLQAMAEAKAKLLESLAQLRQFGGSLSGDADALKRLSDLRDLLGDEDEDEYDEDEPSGEE